MQLSTNIERDRSPKRSRQASGALSISGKYLVLIALACIFVGPFLWLVDIAMKTPTELNVFPVEFLPSHLYWGNLIQAFTSINFMAYAGNSLMLSGMYAILVTLSSAVVGFGFARLRARGKRPLFLIMLSTLMLPNIVTLIPTYMVFSQLNLINTYWPWVFWGLMSSPFLVFLFRQFFSAIPGELEEAAIIDGCGYGRIFWQIFLPLAVPAMVTAFLISFTGVWGDYLTPLLLLGPDNTTLSVAMTVGYIDPHGNALVTVQAAGALLYIVPEILLFFFAQRYFVRGIVTTGLKG
jgi:ABC-type glycerol-3-phosphate transport system permease component